MKSELGFPFVTSMLVVTQDTGRSGAVTEDQVSAGQTLKVGDTPW